MRRYSKIIRSSPLVEQVEIFDVYSGGQVPEGKKSLAYRVGISLSESYFNR